MDVVFGGAFSVLGSFFPGVLGRVFVGLVLGAGLGVFALRYLVGAALLVYRSHCREWV